MMKLKLLLTPLLLGVAMTLSAQTNSINSIQPVAKTWAQPAAKPLAHATAKPSANKPSIANLTSKPTASLYQEQARQAILNVLETQRSAWNKGDLEGYMQGYWKSDSLLFVGKSGANYGWQKTLDNYKRGYPNKAAMGELIFGIKKVEFLTTNHAFVLGSWLVKREKDELKGFFTLVLKNINGKWVIISDHSS